jgi:hypothetical protein
LLSAEAELVEALAVHTELMEAHHISTLLLAAILSIQLEAVVGVEQALLVRTVTLADLVVEAAVLGMVHQAAQERQGKVILAAVTTLAALI